MSTQSDPTLQSPPAAPPAPSDAPPVQGAPKRKGGWPKGRARGPRADNPTTPGNPPASSGNAPATPGNAVAVNPPLSAEELAQSAQQERWALQRMRIAQIAPIHQSLHDRITIPLLLPSLRKAGVNPDERVKVLVTSPTGEVAATELTVKDALSRAISELGALYVPLESLNHPAFASGITCLILAVAIVGPRFGVGKLDIANAMVGESSDSKTPESKAPDAQSK